MPFFGQILRVLVSWTVKSGGNTEQKISLKIRSYHNRFFWLDTIQKPLLKCGGRGGERKQGLKLSQISLCIYGDSHGPCQGHFSIKSTFSTAFFGDSGYFKSRTTRNPTSPYRPPGLFHLRPADRQCSGPLSQEPPRRR